MPQKSPKSIEKKNVVSPFAALFAEEERHREFELRAQAYREIESGKDSVNHADLKTAKRHFKNSIEILPTAEGYTYYAWMLSFEGEYDEAITLCKKAIEHDAEFGNPYNDIGSYLVAKGEVEEAITWFERAKGAKKYEPRHFPYANLGRVYLKKGMLLKAREEFAEAAKILPLSEEIQKILDSIERGIN